MGVRLNAFQPEGLIINLRDIWLNTELHFVARLSKVESQRSWKKSKKGEQR
jgi:hypothetical protein